MSTPPTTPPPATPPPGMNQAVVIISVSIATAITLVENYAYKGAIIKWLWSLTGYEPMPEPVAVGLAILILANVLAILGLWLLGKK